MIAVLIIAAVFTTAILVLVYRVWRNVIHLERLDSQARSYRERAWDQMLTTEARLADLNTRLTEIEDKLKILDEPR